MKKALLIIIASLVLTACGSPSANTTVPQTEQTAPDMAAEELASYKAEMSAAYDAMEEHVNFLLAFLGEEYDWQKHNKRAKPEKTYPNAVAWAKKEYKGFVSMENVKNAVNNDFVKAKAADGYGGEAKKIYEAYAEAFHQFNFLYELAVNPEPDNTTFGGYVGRARIDAEKALSDMKQIKAECMSK